MLQDKLMATVEENGDRISARLGHPVTGVKAVKQVPPTTGKPASSGSSGMIIGIVIGVVLLIILVALAIWYFRCELKLNVSWLFFMQSKKVTSAVLEG